MRVTRSYKDLILTFVSMFAPIEKARPNKGRFGNFCFNHFTVCFSSQDISGGELEVVALPVEHPMLLWRCREHRS